MKVTLNSQANISLPLKRRSVGAETGHAKTESDGMLERNGEE